MAERALVTGGAGFIGSHLAAALVARGHFVRVLDNLSTGSEENVAAIRVYRALGFETRAAFDVLVLRAPGGENEA